MRMEKILGGSASPDQILLDFGFCFGFDQGFGPTRLRVTFGRPAKKFLGMRE